MDFLLPLQIRRDKATTRAVRGMEGRQVPVVEQSEEHVLWENPSSPGPQGRKMGYRAGELLKAGRSIEGFSHATIP